MRLSSIAKRCAATGALASALILAAPAFAGVRFEGDMPPPMDRPGAEMPMPPMPPMPAARMGGARWGAEPPPPMEVDPRARDAWLDECRHRMYHRDREWGEDGRRPDYDYCEAYFDDWFAHFGQGGYAYGGYGYGYPQPMPMMMVPVRHQVRDRDCVCEVVSEEAPARRRVIYRPRPVHDKRVRIAPDKRVPVH
jgi:hypothetical protein